jgi:hypothetical protein
MRYFKGLFLTSETRVEFSSSRVPGFIPCFLEDTLVLLEVLISHTPHTFQKPGWRVWEMRQNEVFLHPHPLAIVSLPDKPEDRKPVCSLPENRWGSPSKGHRKGKDEGGTGSREVGQEAEGRGKAFLL